MSEAAEYGPGGVYDDGPTAEPERSAEERLADCDRAFRETWDRATRAETERDELREALDERIELLASACAYLGQFVSAEQAEVDGFNLDAWIAHVARLTSA